MSILSKAILACVLMVSAAHAGTSCRYHSTAQGSVAVYELQSNGGVFKLTAVKATIDLEVVMEELRLEDMMNDNTLTSDDIDALEQAIDETELLDRQFLKGDVMTISQTANSTVINLNMVAGAGFSAKNVDLILSKEIYNKISTTLIESEQSSMQPGSCN